MKPASTPMMSQYRRIRSGLAPDTILFFRLGDFYEMFFEDAKRAAPILDIALTQRNNVPMCGVPYHAAESYLARLIRAGLKVAVCDQVEDPSAARGIVRREITRIVTPGTVLEGDVLESRRNNFLAALHGDERLVGLALLDKVELGCILLHIEDHLTGFHGKWLQAAKNFMGIFQRQLAEVSERLNKLTG